MSFIDRSGGHRPRRPLGIIRQLPQALLLAAAAAGVAAMPREVPNMRFATVSLPTGVRMHYAEQGSTGGTPIIMLHGYTDSWYSFSRVMPLMSSQYHVYAVDLRGHGNSDRPATGYSLQEMANDVLAFMDAMKLDRAVVLGHSAGGLVAQKVAATAPDRVSALVLTGTGPSIADMMGYDEFRTAIMSLQDPISADFVREFQTAMVQQPVPADFLNTAISESRKVPARVWTAYMQGMIDAPAVSGFGNASFPSLIIWGENDAVFNRQAQDKMMAALPNVKLTVYGATGHSPHWERPERYVTNLEAFLQSAGMRKSVD